MRETRKIAAILVADVVGYSRLAGADEDRTLSRLRGLRSDLIDPAIDAHHGRIVKRTGDGSLIEFRSLVDAVRCAIEVQNGMVERNAGLPRERRIEFRVGIHLGDVVEEADGDLMGDGVNIAARLEGICEPGGICLSEDAYRQVKGRLDLAVADLGPTQLKNIAEPIRVYSLRVGVAAQAKPAMPTGLSGLHRRRASRIALAAGMVFAFLAVGLGAWRLWPRETATAEVTPLIAVLPFTNASGDVTLDTLVPSFARELSAMLSTFPHLRVVSATGLPAQKLANPKQAARDLGAGYALEGDLEKTGDKLRVGAQLTDASSGETVWSDSHEFEGDNPVAIQEKAAVRISGARGGVNGRLLKIEQAASWRKPESTLTEYDYHLRAMTYSMKYTPDDNLRARKIAEEGLARFPESALLKTRLAWSYLLESDALGPYENCRETIEIAYKLGREAVDAKNKSQFQIYQLKKFMGHAYGFRGDFEHSVQELESAVEMSPYDAELRASSALYLAGAGQFDKAIEWVSWAIAHDFQDYVYVKMNTAWTYYLAGRYAEALQALKGVEATEAWPIMVIYVRLGRLDEAKATAAEWLKTGPHSVLAESCEPIREPMKQKYLDDLRKAGVPERTGQ